MPEVFESHPLSSHLSSTAGSPSAANRFPSNLPSGWATALTPESEKSYFQNLVRFLNQEYGSGKTIYPARDNVLKALQAVDLPDVKIVILGQDPYHGVDQALGLCFGVPNTLQPKPPSLVNIFKEIASDLGIKWDGKQSDLTGWAAQGVLLLNTILTVRAGQAFSHRGQGWEEFTDAVIQALNAREDPIVFILWGSAAQKKRELITSPQHKFLEAPHPSPLSSYRGFFGCKHFSKANALLTQLGKRPIDWGMI